MHIKLDHMHIEPHGIRTLSKHQLRAELGILGHLAAAISVILKAYPLIFFLRFVYYFQYFIDTREYYTVISCLFVV